MAVIEFVGQSRADTDNPTAETSRLVNLYREKTEAGYILKSVPGTVAFTDLSRVFLRDMATVDGQLWVVCGETLMEISGDGTAFTRGPVLDGEATICGNNGSVCVSAGGEYYVYDGAGLNTPGGGAFDAVGSVVTVAQQTVMTELGGRRFQWTAVADPLTINGLDYATAEGRDDNLVRAMGINGNLWLFKETCIELWYPDASGFLPMAGGLIETGLKAFGLVVKIDGGAFFVGDDNIVYLTGGGQPTPVSIPAVETDIRYGQPTRCFCYEDEGHKFCAIRFQSRPAWVYDISTGEWHNRAYGVDGDPWPVVSAVNVYGGWKVGTDLGAILTLARVNTDAGAPMRRVATSRTLEVAGTLALMEFVANAGQFSAEPHLMVRLSKDRGRTWGPEKQIGVGSQGNYTRHTRLRAQGWAQWWTAEVAYSDAADVLLRAEAEVVLT